MEKKASGGGFLGIYRYSASPSSHHFPSHYSNLKYSASISPASTRIISPYPNIYHIQETYASRHNPSFFNTHLADNVDGSVAGQHFHLGGRFDSIQAHNDRVLSRIGAALKPETPKSGGRACHSRRRVSLSGHKNVEHRHVPIR